MNDFIDSLLDQIQVSPVVNPVTFEIEFEVYDKIIGLDIKAQDKNILEAIHKLVKKISDQEKEEC